MAESPDYVVIYQASGHLAGEIVRLMLEANDIPTLLRQESAGLALGLTVGRLGEVNVLVPVQREQEAQELIRAMEEGKLAQAVYPGRMSGLAVYKSNKFRPDEQLKFA